MAVENGGFDLSMSYKDTLKYWLANNTNKNKRYARKPNIANPVPYLKKREYGFLTDVKTEIFQNRLSEARNLYRKELICHYGCVNAIEFSSNGELLISGGDDRRVMVWQFGETIFSSGTPVPMKSVHQSNIFCLGITNDNQKIYSGGNDDIVIVHDLENRRPLEVLQHQRAVCSLSIDPFNEQVVATAGNDGRLLLFDTRQSVHESLVISRNRKAFHGVQFHPLQQGVLVSANAKDGVALWDLRAPRRAVLRYVGLNGPCQNSMSVRFNSNGSQILALRRRMNPVLYAVQCPEPAAEFTHPDYYNSCTMKSCDFAGEGDQYVMSGSDDFNLYVWKIPDYELDGELLAELPHLVLYGHRSIVNQVRYNPHYCLIASSGVEKIIKVWSTMEFPQMRGTLLEEVQGSENPREIYSHEDYVSLVHHSGQYISHNYAEQSTSEDPRMMAFFDSLVQRELECLAEETDSLDEFCSDSDYSDTNRIVVNYLPLPSRVSQNRSRCERCPNRVYSTRVRPQPTRLQAIRRLFRDPPERAYLTYTQRRYTQNRTSQTRTIETGTTETGTAETLPTETRLTETRTTLNSSTNCISGSSGKGKRSAVRRSRGLRRAAPRTARPPPSRPSAPSSERTDSDEPAHCRYRCSGRITRPPLRRRVHMTRSTSKRKSKVTNNYRKFTMNLRSKGKTRAQNRNENSLNSFNNFEDNLAQPSTSTGYRGRNTSNLFRIAEVDSDDDQSSAVGSRPISPCSQTNQNVPTNLISIVPTPLNGSRDSLGDSLRVEPAPQSENRRNLRRRRNGRFTLQGSDSSESPKESTSSTVNRVTPPSRGFNRTVARLMNETNESELETSSTEGSTWPAPDTIGTPDSGVGTLVGSSTRNNQRLDDVSDDQEYQAMKLRQRVKKVRRNYRSRMESDSN